MTNAALAVSAVVTFAVDQATKGIFTSRLEESRFYSLAGSLGLRRLTNERALLIPISATTATLFWLVIVALISVAVSFLAPLKLVESVGLGLVIGGAAGNLWDRLRRHGIVDFIAFGRWIFNLADAAMVCGVVLTVWGLT